MHDYDEWVVYGMLACLLVEEDRLLAASMMLEAEGEGMEDAFEEGDAEMYKWQRYQHKQALFSLNCRRRPVYYTGGWPLALH